MAKIKVKCEVCGKEFERLESQLKGHIFCSKECSNSKEGRKLYQSGKNHPRYNSKIMKCDYCGKDIEVNESHMKLNKHHYCSKECADKDKINRTKKGDESPFYKRICCKCDYCGKEIYVHPYRFNKNEKNFCDRDCQLLWQKENWIGSNAPNWREDKTDEEREIERKYKEYTDMVKNALELYNYTCLISGQVGGNLIVHHLNGYIWDIENRLNLNNVVVITKEIHDEFHKRYGKKHNTLEQFKEFYKEKTGKDFKIN